MRIAMALLALALSVSACKKDKKTTGDNTGSGSAMAGSGSSMAGSGSDMAGSGSAAMAGSGSDTMAGSGSGDATTMTKKAGNCPSTVFGSTTKAEVKGKDIVVTVTSDDKDAIDSIQRRAEELLAEKKDHAAGGGGHDQQGTHGGGSGLCPIYVPEGATAVAKKEAKGVAITITPKDKPEDLKKEVDARITKAADWVKANLKEGDKGTQGGVGGGKGEHGGNHSGEGDAKGVERKGAGSGSAAAGGSGGSGGGAGTGGGGGKGTGGGGGHGSGH